MGPDGLWISSMMSSTKITGMLIQWSEGNAAALEELYPHIEKELRRLARSRLRRLRPGNTLQTTALINEAYIRLIDQREVQWQNRTHFYAIAASLMRRILLNYIRDKKALKRGGGAIQISLSGISVISEQKSNELLALEEALIQLAEIDERKSRVVELRYFGGLSVEETAEALGISTPTVMRDWKMAKAFLARTIRNED
jgi:RNA polymerase sigma factor (TIGR02999 family)